MNENIRNGKIRRAKERKTKDRAGVILSVSSIDVLIERGFARKLEPMTYRFVHNPAVLGLNETQRAVFVLKGAGMSFQQIADELGISKGWAFEQYREASEHIKYLARVQELLVTDARYFHAFMDGKACAFCQIVKTK